VILQDDHYAGELPVVLVVPLTTTRAAVRFAGTTLVRPTAENGLRQVSVALVFQLRAIDRRRIQERIGSVSEEVLHEIFEELGKLTGRSE
jgi:mRNA interferase MazF